MKVLVNGQLVEYKDEGSGRVLLFLHGWGTNLGTFDQLVDYFACSFRVIRFDFPGFGQSPKPAEDWSVDDYAKLTRDLLGKLKINDIYAVAGHSFGGRVIIKGVSMGYLQPKKIILIGSAGVKPDASISKNLYKVVAKVGKLVTSIPLIRKVQPMLRRSLYSAVGSSDYLRANEMQKIFLNTISEDLLPGVSKIKQPSLLIWGKDDTETPLKDANLMLKSLENGRLVVIPDAGHFVHVDAYAKVIKEIDSFLI